METDCGGRIAADILSSGDPPGGHWSAYLAHAQSADPSAEPPNYTGLVPSYQTVAFDPTCDNTVYVGVETQATHVFMTTDDGATWTDISGVINGGSGNLPDLPLHSVVIDAGTSPHTIVVASDAGVMQSADLGNTWQVLGARMPTVEVTSLALDSGANPPLLRAGTYGRSVFELGRP